MAYAQTTPQAQQHIKFLRETECCGDEDLLRQFVRVFYYGQYILGKPANGLGNRAIYQPTAS